MTAKTIKFAKVTIIATAAKLNEAIDDVARRGKALDNLIHRAAVSCLYHAREYGDATLLARLIANMPKSSRRKALATWCEDFAPLKIEDDKSGVTATLAKGRTPEQFQLDEAAANPFWDHTVEKDPKPMTIEALHVYLTKISKGGTAARPADELTQQAAKLALRAMLPLKGEDAVSGEDDIDAELVDALKAANA